MVKGTADPNRLELDVHEAYRQKHHNGDSLHYRLARYGFELPTDSSLGRLIPLGVLATRGQFPDAEPKPPENGVGGPEDDGYMDILYGSAGSSGRIATGVSDRHVGLAELKLKRAA